MAGTTYTDWKFREQHVDSSAMLDGQKAAEAGVSGASGTPAIAGRAGNYVSSESIVLCAGPATFQAASSNALADLVTIGVCDTMQVQQNKGVIQLYEIGSRVPYLIPGRPVIQFQISRVLFNGDSLMASLTQTNTITEEDKDAFDATSVGGPGVPFEVAGGKNDSSGKFYLNLASHFFNRPFGLALFFKDSEEQWVAGFYAENCVIQQHSMAIQGQNMVVMENASVRCTSFVPIAGA